MWTRTVPRLDLRPYLYTSRTWIFGAVLPAILAATCAFVVTAVQPKMYKASALLYVQQAQNTTSIGVQGGTDPSSSAQLAQTYSQMVTDPTIQRAVRREVMSRYGPSVTWAVQSDPAPSLQQGSQLFGVDVTDSAPRRAADVANSFARVFIRRVRSLEGRRYAADELSLKRQVIQAKRQISRLAAQISAYRGPASGMSGLHSALSAYESAYQSLFSSLESFEASRDANTDSVSLYSPATVPSSPSGPNPTRNAVLFGFVSLLLCAILVFVYDHFSDLPRSVEEVEEAAAAPVLGTVPNLPDQDVNALVLSDQPKHETAEPYRSIRSNIRVVCDHNPPQSMLVTSARAGEGKTTTSGALARMFASVGTRVCLVEADLRKPSFRKLFSMRTEAIDGLTTMLAVERLNGDGIHETGTENLLLVPRGPETGDPLDLLDSERMNEALDHLKSIAGIVLLDSPPVLRGADAAVLASRVDGVLLVVESNRTRRTEILQARDRINSSGGRLIGVVMNRVHPWSSIACRY